MKRKPYTINALWGVWAPDGAMDGNGCWLLHAQGPCDGPEVYESGKEAEEAAEYYADDFPGCYAAPITAASSKADEVVLRVLRDGETSAKG